jgi:hypothetical protein
MDALQAALEYAERGWHVFPLKAQSKEPATAHGLKDASTDPAQIRKWFEGKDRNIGIATGPSGLAVIDVDNAEGDAAIAPLLGGLRTVAAQTGKGAHLYFRGSAKSRPVLPGVDVKSEGGYVVAPPSIHPDGHAYEWFVRPDQALVADLPESLRVVVEAEAPRLAPVVGMPILEGQRNDQLFRHASAMRRRGLDEDAIFAALASINAKQCQPPLTDIEVRAIARNVAESYAPDTDAMAAEQWADRQRAKAEAEANATVGSQTLDDLPWGASPPQLVEPFLSPEGTTILYGPGGVGKGYVSLWFALQLVRQDKRVTIIDFEYHPFEWGRRAHAMGFTRQERRMVNYRAPFGDGWTAKRGSLAQVAAALRADIDQADEPVDYIIVDSYTTATSTGDAMGGMAAAQEFFGGIALLGRPALVIAHVAGGQEKFPAKPFGSVFVHNLARETWAVERIGDPDREGSMSLELRHRKSNNGPMSLPQFLTFNFAESGKVSVDRDQPADMRLADLAAEVAERAKLPLTVRDLARAIQADTGREVNEAALRMMLHRNLERFEPTDDVPRKWQARK